MRKKRRNIIRIAAVCAAWILTRYMSGTIGVQALVDEKEAVHIDASEIENATLLIGTHLIHLSAMGDEIYRIATNSASDSGQGGQYYKSELADGMWFDIANAFSLKDITGEGTPVEDGAIEGLFLTHHTRSDGITYDLRTGQPVCMFDISNPYDLEHLSELEPLKLQYNILAGKQDKNETDEFCEEKIREFFGTNVRDEETDKLDAQILGLQNYYVSAHAEGRRSAAAAMEAADAARRSIVLGKLRDPLEQLTQLLQGSQADITTGANESLKKLEEGILQYDSLKLSEGTTVLGKEEYAVKQALANAAQAGDVASCDTLAKQAALLTNIKENNTKDAGKELEYLKGTILPAAKKAYADLLTNGAGEQYQTEAAKEHATLGILQAALKEQFLEAEAAKSEMQFLENAALGKMSAEEGKSFLRSLMQEAEGIKNEIQEDDFSSYAKDSIESYTSYLNTLRAQRDPTENESAQLGLMEQKDKKQEEKLLALEANDLAGAKKAEAQIEEQDLLEEIADGELEGLSEEEQAAVLLALLEFLEQYANSEMEQMAQSLAAQMEAGRNRYLFRQYNDPVNEYIPLKTISECLGYRYVFDNNKKKATLVKKSSYCTFYAFALTYEKGEETGELSRNAGFLEDIYLPVEDAEELFQCSSKYIPKSSLGLLITQEHETRASEYLSMLLTRLGG